MTRALFGNYCSNLAQIKREVQMLAVLKLK